MTLPSEGSTPLWLVNTSARAPGVTCLGNRYRSDMTGRKQYAAGTCKFAGRSSRSDATGQVLQEWHDWPRAQDETWLPRASGMTRLGESNTPLGLVNPSVKAPGVTWLGNRSRTDMTGQVLQEWHDHAIIIKLFRVTKQTMDERRTVRHRLVLI